MASTREADRIEADICDWVADRFRSKGLPWINETRSQVFEAHQGGYDKISGFDHTNRKLQGLINNHEGSTPDIVRAFWNGFYKGLSILESRMTTGITKDTNTVSDAIAHGAKVSIAAAAADELVQFVEKQFGDSYPPALKTPHGHELVKFLLAAGLVEFQKRSPGTIPAGEHVVSACSYIIDDSVRTTLKPLLANLGPVFEKLAEAGRAVEAAPAPIPV